MATSNYIQTRYYKVIENNSNTKATHLKAEIYYSLGGMNYFSSKVESRGYYISVSPVERTQRDYGTMESYTAFTGLKQCVIPVERKSKKKAEEAVKYFEEHVEEFMKNHFGEFKVDLENCEVR